MYRLPFFMKSVALIGVLLSCLLYTHVDAQPTAIQWEHHFTRYNNDLVYRASYDAERADWVRYAMTHDANEAGNRSTLTIPVVIHIVHLPGEDTPQAGTSNPTDFQAIEGLRFLNEAFSKTGSHYGDSVLRLSNAGVRPVDTQIRFCLAQVDPDGAPTTGITRHASPLSDVNRDVTRYCPGEQTEDYCMKKDIGWDQERYLNIYLVNSVCGGINGQNCSVNGYGWAPNNHGDVFDGVVIENRLWGVDILNSADAARYTGQYFGLKETYFNAGQDGCENINCLLNGDQICDTPPDSDPSGGDCVEWMNSCSTEINDTLELSPFEGDVQDIYENIMDGGDPSCRWMFTLMQRQEMRRVVLQGGARHSLIDFNGGVSPCTGILPDVADVKMLDILNPDLVTCSPDVKPTIRLINTGNVDVTDLIILMVLDAQATQDTINTFIAVGDTVDIPYSKAQSLAVGGHRLRLKIRDINKTGEGPTPFDQEIIQPLIRTRTGPVVTDFPVCQDFAQGAFPSDWLAADPDHLISFDLKADNGCDSPNDFMLRYNSLGNFYNGDSADKEGTWDYMVSPVLDLTDFNRANFDFDIAYRSVAGITDLRFRVWAVRACEPGPPTILLDLEGEGISNGQVVPNNPDLLWKPTDCSDWSPQSLNLSSFGGESIRLVLEIRSPGAVVPNLYLDNICLNAEFICEAPTTIPSVPGTYVADRVCTDADNWTHFYTSVEGNPMSGEPVLIFSAKDLAESGAVIEPSQVKLILTDKYGAGGHNLSETGAYVENVFGWHVMGRYLEVNPTQQPENSLTVRFFHSEGDLEDMAAQTPDPAAFEVEKLVFFSMDNGINSNPVSGHSGVEVENYREYFSGEDVSLKTWISEFYADGYTVELAVPNLGTISGGTGGEGLGYGARYPIPFANESAQQMLGRVKVMGTIPRQVDTDSVELYRSVDGGEFERIDARLANAGATDSITYELWDDKPSTSSNAYYLRMVHESGIEILSDTLEADFDLAKLVQAYPNPAREELWIAVDAKENVRIQLEILNAAKQVLSSYAWTHQDNQPQKVDISDMPRGMYFYRVYYQGQAYWGKIIHF